MSTIVECYNKANQINRQRYEIETFKLLHMEGDQLKKHATQILHLIGSRYLCSK
jgi:hypothetical protein